MKQVISVIGASVASKELQFYAEDVGREIARRGYILACGGRGGVMEAACRGAKEAGGVTIGFLPSLDKHTANKYVDIAIPTGIGVARNFLVVGAGDGVVVIGGGSGTLSEIAFAWQMGKPIVAIKPSGGWAGRLAGMSLDDRRTDKIEMAKSGAEAINMLEGYLKSL